jgi:hypothetical protein
MDTTILPLTIRPPSTLAQQVGALVARWHVANQGPLG